ncbi:hypothetical protein ACPPVV_07675 [Rhodanobacter sp. Col0626]|uniref:hypothetical protein n=1 Tax=Rhodanobacter sp. Col0626 TaxID=3415679 RepID=UPI003CEBDE4F
MPDLRLPLPRLLCTLMLCSLSALAACSSGQSAADGSAQETHSALGTVVNSAMDKAREKMRTANVKLSSDHDSNLPRAEITPQGDLLIAGKVIDVTPQQRTLLLQYRTRVLDIASAGMDIGVKGADMGMRVAGQAIAGALSGKSEQEINQRANAEASGIRESAAKLCDRMPALQATQQELAASLPAFRPYATMNQKDVADCRKDAMKDDDDETDNH